VGLLVAVYTYSKKSSGLPGPVLFISAGFIGVVGSGLILSRPEMHLVFHGAACLFAYSYCSKNRVPKSTALTLLILLIVASNISFFVHSQGLIFAPITLLLMYRLSKSFDKIAERIAVISATLYISMSVWYEAMLYRNIFRCTESQAITDFISFMTLPGWLKSADASGVSDRIKQEFFVRFGYFDRFYFAQKFQIDYLPPTNYQGAYLGELVGLLNTAILLLTGAILLAFVSLCIYLLVRVCIRLNGLRREKSARLTGFVSFATSNQIMFFTVCWGHLGLLFIATQMNFYRAFYLNLAMVVLLFIAFHQTSNKFVGKVSLVVGILSLAVCSVSIIFAREYIYPQLMAGYAGPSIPLSSDWRRIETDVNSLKKLCGISDADTRVIVDDMTYDALKKHREYLAITYIGLGSEIMKASMQSALKDVKPTAAITRCEYFESYNLPYKGRVNGLCCATFNNDLSKMTR
jgi:hypothetical protein